MSANTRWQRFNNLDGAILEPAPPAPVLCTYCGDSVEPSPVMRGVCYDCYRSLVETFRMVDERRARDIAAFADETERLRQALECESDAEWLGSELPPVTTWEQAMQARERNFNRRYYNNPDGKPEFKY